MVTHNSVISSHLAKAYMKTGEISEYLKLFFGHKFEKFKVRYNNNYY